MITHKKSVEYDVIEIQIWVIVRSGRCTNKLYKCFCFHSFQIRMLFLREGPEWKSPTLEKVLFKDQYSKEFIQCHSTVSTLSKPYRLDQLYKRSYRKLYWLFLKLQFFSLWTLPLWRLSFAQCSEINQYFQFSCFHLVILVFTFNRPDWLPLFDFWFEVFCLNKYLLGD